MPTIEVTAISFHAYPYLQERYALMPSGGSVGDGYGPMIIAAKNYSLDEVKKLKIAIPGTLTTAVLALKLFAPQVQTEVVPFDKIIPAVLEGRYDAGLIIHEGQLTYDRSGLNRILDLGKWWREETGLPLPLGATPFARIWGRDHRQDLQGTARQHPACAGQPRTGVAYAMQFARDLDQPMQTNLWACT